MAKKIVNSFNAGELSPYLYAREDIDKYQSGCQELENFVPLPYGGVIRRPAIQRITDTKNDVNARLYPFTFNVNETFMLEIGNTGTTNQDGYFRFYKNKQIVLDETIDLTDITKFKWTQGTVSGSPSKYYYCTLPDDSDPSLSDTSFIIVDGVTIFKRATASGIAPSFFIKDNDSLGFQTIYLKLTNSGASGQNPNTFTGTLTLGQPAFEITHPYLTDEIKDLKFTQSADVLFITHPNHPVKTLNRTSSENDASWNFTDFDFDTGYPPLREENTTTALTISTSNKQGNTILTASGDVFETGHVGAYFRFKSIRDKANSTLNKNYNSSNISSGINVSNSNWNITTNGTWLGKVTLQRSLDGGVTYNNYIVIGDTSGNGTTASATVSKNFTTSSEQPEENNTFIRLKYDNTDVSDAFSFSLVVENQYLESLVQITAVDSSTQAQARIVSPFQDSILEYTNWTTSQAFNVGDKVNENLPFANTTFTGAVGSIDLSVSANVVLGGSETGTTLTQLDNTKGMASGEISVSNLFGTSATLSPSDITQIAYDHTTEVATITTSANHQVAKGMKINFENITSSTLPLLTGQHLVTVRTDATNFKISLSNGGLSASGNYTITNANLSIVGQRHFYVISDATSNVWLHKFFISPEDDTITLLKSNNIFASNDMAEGFDVAFNNDNLYVVGYTVRGSATKVRFNKYGATTLNKLSTVSDINTDNGNATTGIRGKNMYPRSIGTDGAGGFYYAQITNEVKTTGKFHQTFNRNVNYIFRLNINMGVISTTTLSNSTFSDPFISDIFGIDGIVYTLDSQNNKIQKRVSTSINTLLDNYSVDTESTLMTGMYLNQVPTDATLEESILSITTAGVLFKYQTSSETNYFECVKEITSSSPTYAMGFGSQFDAGHWNRLSPKMNKWTEGAFSTLRGFPACLALYQNRMVFSGVASYPDTLWLSRSDDYTNFLLGTLATSAMKLTINSGNLDSIQWLVPHEALIIGTSGSEWSLEPESDRKPISPVSFALNRKTTYGSNTTQATLINSVIIFAMRQGRKVREWTYDYNQDEFIAPDLTIFSEHITEGGIINWSYQQQPDNILWLIRNDGQLLGFTYEREQKVFGWHRHTVDSTGKFLSVNILPNPQSEDEVYTISEYTINPPDWVASGTYTFNQNVDYNGTCYVCIQDHTGRSTTPPMDAFYWSESTKTKRAVGVFKPREYTNYTTDFCGVDYATKFESPETAELSGLDYLEGKTVNVVIDGIPSATTYTVNAGKINIGTTGHTTIYVGLNYTATLAPMYLDTETTSTTTLGSKKDVQRATIRFKDT